MLSLRSGKKKNATTAPKAISCPLCNGKYFKKSFPIHYKQCELLYDKTHEKCPNCGRMVHKDDFMSVLFIWQYHSIHYQQLFCQYSHSNHEEHCVEENAAMKRAAAKRHSEIRNMSMEAYVEKSLNHKEGEPSLAEEAAMDFRVSCKFCGRKFNPDRVDKHQAICSNVRPESQFFSKKPIRT